MAGPASLLFSLRIAAESIWEITASLAPGSRFFSLRSQFVQFRESHQQLAYFLDFLLMPQHADFLFITHIQALIKLAGQQLAAIGEKFAGIRTRD